MNEQMNFEKFMKEIMKQIDMANIGQAAKTQLKKESLDDWRMYFEYNLTPQIAVQAMLMGA